jgi:hypothetical protein
LGGAERNPIYPLNFDTPITVYLTSPKLPHPAWQDRERARIL